MKESELINAPVCVLAVDPGLSGAVCKLGRGEFQILRDFKKLSDIAYAIQKLSYGVTHAVIEAVGARPGQGVCSMFSFGRATGVADGALALCLPAGLEVSAVAPLKWQNFCRMKFGIPRPRLFRSTELASRLLPNFSQTYFKRVKDHNSADASLMAIWRLVDLCKF